MRLLAQRCKWYHPCVIFGVDNEVPVGFYDVPRQFVALLDPDIYIFVYMLTIISDTRCLYQYVRTGSFTRSTHLIM